MQVSAQGELKRLRCQLPFEPALGLAQFCVRIQPRRDNLMGGWGRPQKIVRDGGWIDYSYGKGRGDSAKSGWGDHSYWQSRGFRGSGGAKNNRPNEVVPRSMPPWTAVFQKTLDAMVKAAVGQQQGKTAAQPVKAQGAKKDTKKEKKEDWCCPCGFKNFGFRADCKECGQPKQEAEAEEPGGMEVDCGSVKADPPEKVAKELRNVLSSLTGMKSTNVQGNLMVLELQMRLQAAEDEIRQGKPALVRLQAATRQKEALGGEEGRPEDQGAPRGAGGRSKWARRDPEGDRGRDQRDPGRAWKTADGGGRQCSSGVLRGPAAAKRDECGSNDAVHGGPEVCLRQRAAAPGGSGRALALYRQDGGRGNQCLTWNSSEVPGHRALYHRRRLPQSGSIGLSRGSLARSFAGGRGSGDTAPELSPAPRRWQA